MFWWQNLLELELLPFPLAKWSHKAASLNLMYLMRIFWHVHSKIHSKKRFNFKWPTGKYFYFRRRSCATSETHGSLTGWKIFLSTIDTIVNFIIISILLHKAFEMKPNKVLSTRKKTGKHNYNQKLGYSFIFSTYPQNLGEAFDMGACQKINNLPESCRKNNYRRER